MPATLRVGIDVGGTFTDLFLLDEATGEVVRHKLSSTPDDPYKAPIRGLAEILEKAGRLADELRFVGLGSSELRAEAPALASLENLDCAQEHLLFPSQLEPQSCLVRNYEISLLAVLDELVWVSDKLGELVCSALGN